MLQIVVVLILLFICAIYLCSLDGSDDDMISYASMMSLADDRFDDFDDENEDDNMAKRRSGSSFGSFRGSIGKSIFIVILTGF